MSSTELYGDGPYPDILQEVCVEGMAVANQYLIVHGMTASLLDPGNRQAYARLRGATRGAGLNVMMGNFQLPPKG